MFESGKIYSELGEFYVGDPCYILSESAYYSGWGERYGWGNVSNRDTEISGEYTSTGRPAIMTCHSTKYGDGGYYGEYSDKVYGVDAGIIGIVPAELFDEAQMSTARRGGNFFKGNEMSMIVDDDYTFTFFLNGRVVDIIPTGDTEDEYDEEDDWDYYGLDDDEDFEDEEE